MLAACGSAPMVKAPVSERATQAVKSQPSAPAARLPRDAGGPVVQARSRWIPVLWSDLPGFTDDNLYEAWNAWIRSCERVQGPLAELCPEVRRLSIAGESAQRSWLQERFQPYRVESLQGDPDGLLTGYFEPMIDGRRTPTAEFRFPVYGVPSGLGQRKPWFSRQEMETVAEATTSVRDRVLVYLADPVDAQVLQIQGSGRVRLVQEDGTERWIRLGYAGSNDHPYRSMGRWLLDQGLVRDASWSGVKLWLQQNPQRQQELLWVNPRVVFFKELPPDPQDSVTGPRGAQGSSLTPGRSIAVDPGSVPLGSPVWISTTAGVRRLVMAQDTGSAIVGGVRADYFVGTGTQAGEAAGRIRQKLQMWVLWPK